MSAANASAYEGSEIKKRPLILVVDDSQEILSLVETVLVRHGYRVTTAEDGKRALERIAEEPPRLILLDMRMPVMNGWEFVRVFRDLYGRSIPITVMTAAEDSELWADEVGADSYIGKPFNLKDLCRVVDDTALESSE